MKLNILKFHVLPILISLIFIYFIDVSTKKSKAYFYDEIKGKQENTTRIQANYSAGIQSEINFVSSLQNKNSICLLGSSEFGNDQLKYYPYLFLNDSLNMNVFAFGHAFHQCFSIYTQLLAHEDQLENANVCIILSPSWFITEGTNIEAFIEFVPDHYLKKIIHNPAISYKEKLIIGEYIHDHFDEINEPTLSLSYLSDLYKFKDYPFLTRWVENDKSSIKDVHYSIKLLPKNKPLKSDKSLVKKHLKDDYLKRIKSNKIFVNDAYYLEYLSTKDHPYENAMIEADLFHKKREFNDFKLLVELLKRKKCHASFVFQPLNNFHYKGIENFKPLKKDILTILKRNNFPILDLFFLSKEAFEPGVLNDIMHTGDYGWTKINQFIYTTYYKSLAK